MDSLAVRYFVNDVSLAAPFYCEHLGFELRARPAPQFAILAKGPLTLMLSQPGFGGAGQPLSDGSRPEPGGWNRIQIAVANLGETCAKLESAGVVFRSELVEGQGGRQRLVEDPSGNLIELLEPRRDDPRRDEVKAVPPGFATVTPFFAVDDAEALVRFIDRAFGGTIHSEMRSSDGVLRHAVVEIAGSKLMISSGVDLYGKRPQSVHLYVNDVDAAYDKAMGARAQSLEEPNDLFYGDRRAGVKDDWDNHWWLATHVENLSPEQLREREAAFRKG